ncbi:hypothetical protein [Streptomyces abyssalis]|uniref:hypothetical protein n=1 Tax=Streptomyces abyssalis TaxID=933944 RepID=UPI001112D01D|nr:hypothetical protein [Streptomyces abyssalis]
MAERSEGQPEGGTAPVFVDNSGGRRRRWRRLGLALGAVGGGYALVVAVTVAGGNSEAPWGVLIPGDGDSPRATRVIPERDDEAQKELPGADASPSGEPSPGGSVTPGASGADDARVPGSSSESSPAARPSGKKAPAQDASKSGGAGVKKGGQGGTSGAKPPAGSANGGSGSTGSTGSTGGGTPAEPGPDPSESPESPDPSPQGGILDQILDQLGGGSGDGASRPSAAGAE